MGDPAFTDIREEYTPTPTQATYWFLLAVLFLGVVYPLTIPVLVG
jgi:hypothetical protein